MTSDFELKDRYTFADLKKIMAVLRGQGGCPWDRAQTHRSIRRNLIEETYEAVEAIDRRDPDLLCEELGDVLLQAVFHAQIEQEAGRFTVDDVVDGVCKKLVRRHPHVFGNFPNGREPNGCEPAGRGPEPGGAGARVATAEQGLAAWDAAKSEERGRPSGVGALRAVPRMMPALMRSEKVIGRARKAGLDTESADALFERAERCLSSLKPARPEAGPVAMGPTAEPARRASAMGELLFALAGIAQRLGVEPEEALTLACDRFIEKAGRETPE